MLQHIHDPKPIARSSRPSCEGMFGSWTLGAIQVHHCDLGPAMITWCFLKGHSESLGKSLPVTGKDWNNEEKQGRFGKSIFQSTFWLLNEGNLWLINQPVGIWDIYGCHTDHAPFPKVYHLVVLWYWSHTQKGILNWASHPWPFDSKAFVLGPIAGV